MLHAAKQLFAERGYLATTTADVAAAAGVSTPLVFAVFGSKPRLLATAIAAAVRGDDSDTPLRERPAWREMIEAPTGVTLLARFAELQQAINARVGALIDAARAAAATEPALAELITTGAANRWTDCHEVAHRLHDQGRLRAGVAVDTAADILWATCGADVYRLLVTDKQWSAEAYQHWLTRTLAAHLLPAIHDPAT